MKYVNEVDRPILGSKMSIDVDPAIGDGTVPLISANVGNYMNPEHTYYANDSHVGLMKDDNVINEVLDILENHSQTLETGIQKHPQLEKLLKLKVDCPVDLNVYDANGNHVGKSQAGNPYDEQIDGSSFYENNDTEIAFLKDKNYNVQLKGTGTGTMTYTVQEFDENGKVDKTDRFDDVTISSNTKITTNTDVSQNIILNVDDDGNGTIDRTISPSAVINGQDNQDVTNPTVSVDLNGTEGHNGWYQSDVKLTINAQDNESGIYKVLYSVNGSTPALYNGTINVSNEGVNKVKICAIDKNGNSTGEIDKEVKIDKSGPAITTNIEDGQELLLNNDYEFKYDAKDDISGVSDVSSTLKNGSKIDTSTLGNKKITVTAKDNAGNVCVKEINYKVKYDFGKLNSLLNSNTLFSSNQTKPISINGSTISILGSLFTNNNFDFSGSKLDIIGDVSTVGKFKAHGSSINVNNINENVSKWKMPDVTVGIRALLRSQNSQYISKDQKLNGNEVNLGSAIIDGNLSAYCSNFKGNGNLDVKNNISINSSSVLFNQKSIICSENGNIDINTSQCSINGVIYAPNGTVTIHGSNINILGNIVADRIIINGSSISINKDTKITSLFDN